MATRASLMAMPALTDPTSTVLFEWFSYGDPSSYSLAKKPICRCSGEGDVLYFFLLLDLFES